MLVIGTNKHFCITYCLSIFLTAVTLQQNFVKNTEKPEEMTEIIIEIGDHTFEGILYNNPSAQATILFRIKE